MDVSRRGVIGSFGALAALAVVPGTTKALPLAQQDMLVRILKRDGRIDNAAFLIDGPIDIRGLNCKIFNCTVTASDRFVGEHMLIAGGGRSEISNCFFHANRKTRGACISVYDNACAPPKPV